jgi:hypothetical protein
MADATVDEVERRELRAFFPAVGRFRSFWVEPKMSTETRLEYHRRRAKSARALTAKLRDQGARLDWLKIVGRYDSLADMAERAGAFPAR